VDVLLSSSSLSLLEPALMDPPELLAVAVEEEADAVSVAVADVLAVSVSGVLALVVSVSSVMSAEVSKAAAFALLLVMEEDRALASSEMVTVSPDELELLELLAVVDAALRTDEEPELEDVASLYVESRLSMADIETSFVTPLIGHHKRKFRVRTIIIKIYILIQYVSIPADFRLLP
jgi:hypothetical protein